MGSTISSSLLSTTTGGTADDDDDDDGDGGNPGLGPDAKNTLVKSSWPVLGRQGEANLTGVFGLSSDDDDTVGRTLFDSSILSSSTSTFLLFSA